MEKPLCKKCRGNLEHRPVESNFWICTRCGCRHMYVEPMTKEEMEVKKLEGRIKNHAEQLEHELAELTAFIETIRMKVARSASLRREIVEILESVQRSHELLCVSMRSAEEVLKVLRIWVASDGGHFEVLELK